jgi:hypothetical protein
MEGRALKQQTDKMFAMAGQPNWSKHGTVATSVSIVGAIVLLDVAEIWPPDPAHPMSLDFLSRAITTPPWLVASLVIEIVIMTRSFVQWRMRARLWR